MYEAAIKGNISIVKAALHFGADPDFQKNGRTPLQMIFVMLCQSDSKAHLSDLEKKKNLENLTKILFRAGANINLLDCPKKENGFASLHYTAIYSNIPRAEWLLSHKANIELKTFNGRTPLMIACTNGESVAEHSIFVLSFHRKFFSFMTNSIFQNELY